VLPDAAVRSERPLEEVRLVEDEPTVPELVERAVRGDQAAWGGIVERYTPLLMSVLRGYRLREEDLRDVAQTVWLRLVEHLGHLREPRALPMWIVTTAKHESVRVLKARARTSPFSAVYEDEADMPQTVEREDLDAALLRDERRTALLAAFAELPARDRALLALLVADPPIRYADISRRLGMPVGSIGPTRARVLAKLRASPSLRPFDDGPATGLCGTTSEERGGRRGTTAVGR
jgi:RNA polymerase sigma factor (sigma-70 family)